jgi:hypothetical protein
MTDVSDLLDRARTNFRSWWEDPDDDAEHDTDALVELHDLSVETRRSPEVDENGAGEAIDAGIELLSSDDPIDRRFAVLLLREMHLQERRIAGALADHLQRETDSDLLPQAIYGLVYGGDQRAIPLLMPFVHHEDEDVRYAVAGALSKCSPRTLETDVRNALITLGQDPVADVRYSALFELASWWEHERFRDPRVRTALEAGTHDADEQVRDACEEALEAP